MWGSKKNSNIPKVERMEFSIRNFTGGINNVASPSRLQDHESPDMLNITFAEDGTLQKRPGLTIDSDLPEIPYLSDKDDCFDVHEIEFDNNRSGFVVNQRDGFKYITSDGRLREMIWERWSSDNVSCCRFMDKFFVADSGGKLHYFKISELEGTGKIWRYYVSNPPKDYTPNPKPATNGVIKEKVVDESVGTKDIWYEPCQYELEDGYKGVNFAEFNPTIVTTVKDRLYVSGNVMDNNMVYISDILEPHYFPASLPVQLPPTGDKVTAMHIFNNTLVIARHNDIYALHGNTNRNDSPEAYRLIHINTHTGMPNDRCANIVQHFLFYVGSDGNCYKMSPSLANTSQIITQQLNTKVNFKSKPFNKKLEDIQGAITGFEKTKSEWYIKIGDDLFIYNYPLMAWTRYNNIGVKTFVPTFTKFYFVSEHCEFQVFDKNKLYDYKPVERINVPIHSYWQSKDIDFGRPSRVKQVRDTYLVAESFDRISSTINVLMNVDYVDVTKEHNVTSETSYWDEAKWDSNKFIGNNIYRSFPMMIGRRGKVFSVLLSNQGKFSAYFHTTIDEEQVRQMDYGDIFYVYITTDEQGNMVVKKYKRTNYNVETGKYYTEVSDDELFQPMKIYEFNGLYELKGYR